MLAACSLLGRSVLTRRFLSDIRAASSDRPESGGGSLGERKAAFCDPPTGPNQVWQFDFSEYETSRGGTWRTAGVADYWSKYEFGWHWSATANQHDAVAGVELAIGEAARPLGGSLLEAVTNAQTGVASGYDLTCRLMYDLTCRSRQGDHVMGSPPATRVRRSLRR